MRRYLILFLMLCGLVYGAELTYYLGGSASSTNHPLYQLSSFAPSSAVGTNGGPKYDASAGTCTEDADPAGTTITKAGEFAVSLENMYVHCDATGDMADGDYKILQSSADAITIDLAWNANYSDDTVDCWVGGAKPATGAQLNAMVADASFDAGANTGRITVRIYASTNPIVLDDQLSEAGYVDYQWVFNTASSGGTADYPIEILACDSAYAYSAGSVEIEPSANNSTSLVQNITNSYVYVIVRGFVFDGADYSAACFANYTTGAWFFDDCEFKRGDTRGVYNYSTGSLRLYNCTVHDINVGANLNGIVSDASGGIVAVYGSSIYDCTGHGIYLDSAASLTMVQSRIVDCTLDGLNLSSSADSFLIVYNTIANCGSDGIQTDSGTTGHLVIGNTFYKNGAYGINSDSAASVAVLGNNYFYQNTTGETDLDWANTDAELATTGNTYDTDPLFVDADNATPASRDYNYQSTSPCLNEITAIKGNIGGSTVYPLPTGRKIYRNLRW